MKLYDSIIQKTLETLPDDPARFPYDTSRIWKDRGESELIMLRDAAFELGGSSLPSVNYTCVTTSGLIEENETWVFGPDLPDLKSDSAFAKIVLLETEDLGETEDEEKAYDAIRNLEFVRYHVFPAGYMVRVSSESNREQVRVSKKVMQAGIRFAYVGNTYIRRYKAIPCVKKVRVIFITDEKLVEALLPNAGKVDAITKTLTHILDGLPTDCGHCSLKPVCDEVEGMRELHMGKKNKNQEEK
ncbi:MAG: hypothetical protein E7240_02870 [Lachnospiraceae bacterium]|nr:hypothetical protein [Lachnospiraceae bacterium]